MDNTPRNEREERERYEALNHLEAWLETPVMVLGVIWLILLVVELTWGLSPFLNALVYFIWAVFILDFAVRFFLAPKKLDFLKTNWLSTLSLFIPALRIGRLAQLTRVFRAARAARGMRLVSLLSSFNRGMRTLRKTMRQRGAGYVLLLTLVVVLLGAAGMYAFEGQGFTSYSEAVWWTAMIMTTLGSQYWPTTVEGRLLTLLLSIYAFAMFGYVTATLASFFLGSQQEPVVQEEQDNARNASIQSLRSEIDQLRAEIRSLQTTLQDKGQIRE